MNYLQAALARILRPLIRVLIARGIRFPEFSDWLKEHYLIVAERYFRLGGKRVTDSRLHLLTGLQRKDIKAIRSRVSIGYAEPNAGPIARIIGLWLAQYPDTDGAAQPIKRLGPAPSFQAIVGSVSRDMHLRTVQDEMVRLNLAIVEGDHISLTSEAFLPAADDAALMGYFGANLGDHAAAATENILLAPDPGSHLERAVHYNQLSDEALEELNKVSRDALTEALTKINARATALQQRDQGRDDATGRFRAGAFIYRAKDGES